MLVAWGCSQNTNCTGEPQDYPINWRGLYYKEKYRGQQNRWSPSSPSRKLTLKYVTCEMYDVEASTCYRWKSIACTRNQQDSRGLCLYTFPESKQSCVLHRACWMLGDHIDPVRFPEGASPCRNGGNCCRKNKVSGGANIV